MLETSLPIQKLVEKYGLKNKRTAIKTVAAKVDLERHSKIKKLCKTNGITIEQLLDSILREYGL